MDIEEDKVIAIAHDEDMPPWHGYQVPIIESKNLSRARFFEDRFGNLALLKRQHFPAWHARPTCHGRLKLDFGCGR